MAFDYTEDESWYSSNLRWVRGTFTNGAGDTGGAITTSLANCLIFDGQLTAGTGIMNMTHASGVITVETAAGEDGIWWAAGVS